MHESAWSNSFKDVLKKEYGRHLPVVDTKGMIIVSHARRCETTSGQLEPEGVFKLIRQAACLIK